MPVSSPPTFKNPAQQPIDLTGASLGQVIGVTSIAPVKLGLTLGGGAANTSTFANLPAANSVPAGTIYSVTNVPGVDFVQFYSNGTRWRPVNGAFHMEMATPISMAGNAALQTLASIPLPAGLLLPNSSHKMSLLFNATVTAGGTSINLCFAANGSNSIWSVAQSTAQGTNLYEIEFFIPSNQQTLVQLFQNGVISNPYITRNGTPYILTLDFTAAQTLYILQAVQVGDTGTLEGFNWQVAA